MRINSKALVVFAVLSLAPLAITGSIIYTSGVNAIHQSLGSYFSHIAGEQIQKIDYLLFGVYRDVENVTKYEVIQEVTTGDVNGKISSLLIEIQKQSPYFSNLSVINLDGKIVASSAPNLIEKSMDKSVPFNKAVSNEIFLEDIHFNRNQRQWVITFAFPIPAKLQPEKIIGVLYADLKLDELFHSDLMQLNLEHLMNANIVPMTKVDSVFRLGARNVNKQPIRLMIVRSDGLLIYAPGDDRGVFQKNLLNLGMQSGQQGIARKTGYLIESDENGKSSLIGYDYSKGHRDFPGLGWIALVSQDVKSAFAPIDSLRDFILGISFLIMVSVFVISIFVSKRITAPLLNIAHVAGMVTQGNFNKRVENVVSRDEIGQLASSFNQMIDELDRLIDKEKELAAQTAVTEVERKKASEIAAAYENLEREKEQKELILNTAGEGIYGLDFNGNITFVNPSTEKLVGYSTKELIGKSQNIILDHSKLNSSSSTGNALSYNADIQEWEVRSAADEYFRKKDGSRFPVEYTSTPIRKNNRIIGAVVTFNDITGRKKIELEIEQQRKSLEKTNIKLAQSEKSLRKALIEMKKSNKVLLETQNQLIQSEKMATIGTLSLGLAHEVKNPLATILFGVEYLVNNIPASSNDSNAPAVLDDIKSAVQRADVVIRDVLEYSTFTKVHMEKQSINAVIRDTLLLIKHELDQNHVNVTKKLDDTIPDFDLNKNKMEQIFVNLLLNSVEAMESGGTITITTFFKKISDDTFLREELDQNVFKKGDHALFVEIDDSGYGIPEDIIDKVFDPFFTTKRDSEGTGLGLSIVRNLVNLHKGNITLKNRGEGGVKTSMLFKV